MRIDLSKVVSIFMNNAPVFMHGVIITIVYALVGTFFGLIIGLALGGIRSVSINRYDSPFMKVLKTLGNWFTEFYIWILRGTPMMVQALFFYYLLKPVVGWNGFEAGLWVISINTGAYMAEIIRSGIQSIDQGQKEAASALGLSTCQTLLHIVLPQAIVNSFPSIGNQFIVNIKDSSMLNVLSVTELYFQTSSIAGSNFRYIETFLISALIYLALTSIATLGLNWIERKLNKSNKHSGMDFCA